VGIGEADHLSGSAIALPGGLPRRGQLACFNSVQCKGDGEALNGDEQLPDSGDYFLDKDSRGRSLVCVSSHGVGVLSV
jgi:hypothetical protein